MSGGNISLEFKSDADIWGHLSRIFHAFSLYLKWKICASNVWLMRKDDGSFSEAFFTSSDYVLGSMVCSDVPSLEIRIN